MCGANDVGECQQRVKESDERDEQHKKMVRTRSYFFESAVMDGDRIFLCCAGSRSHVNKPIAGMQ